MYCDETQKIAHFSMPVLLSLSQCWERATMLSLSLRWFSSSLSPSPWATWNNRHSHRSLVIHDWQGSTIDSFGINHSTECHTLINCCWMLNSSFITLNTVLQCGDSTTAVTLRWSLRFSRITDHCIPEARVTITFHCWLCESALWRVFNHNRKLNNTLLLEWLDHFAIEKRFMWKVKMM